ncbi:MAG: hypothetical protein ACI3WU_02340 [Phascolarctobacterium sp.]
MQIKQYIKGLSLEAQGKRLGNVALLVMGIAVLGLSITQIAVPSYMKLQGIWQQGQQQRQRLERITRFANQHADYEAYEAGKFKELVNLKQKVQQLGEINQLQKQLQLWAVKQGIELKNMQIITEEKGKQPVAKDAALGMSKLQLKLELVGEYFAVLRWLKQVEKQRLGIRSIEIKGDGLGLVSAKLALSCEVVAAK